MRSREWQRCHLRETINNVFAKLLNYGRRLRGEELVNVGTYVFVWHIARHDNYVRGYGNEVTKVLRARIAVRTQSRRLTFRLNTNTTCILNTTFICRMVILRLVYQLCVPTEVIRNAFFQVIFLPIMSRIIVILFNEITILQL